MPTPMPMPMPLPNALPGQRIGLASRAGPLSCYVDGPASAGPGPRPRPLLLIHSVNAAGSAYEMGPLYAHYRTRRAVYAIDLPGFGFSSRSDRRYTPRLMTDAVLAMTAEILRREGNDAGDGRIDAIALSLGAEFLARAAAEEPAAFASLALISPTGFDGRARAGAPGSTRGMPWLYRAFTVPLWSRPFYDLLTTRRGVRYFLQRTWGSKAIDPGMLDYDVLTARDPGAHHAVFYFVSGYLFSNDIHRVYDALEMPVWLSHGVRGDFTDYRRTRSFAGRGNWTIEAFDTGALPHFEQPAAFLASYDAFLARSSGPGAAAPADAAVVASPASARASASP
jgi:pimeloyl-ACP methyl ester carboxylesterase